jgi:predicted small integral membrane protein
MTTIGPHRMTNLTASVAAGALAATLAACAILGGVMLTHSNLSSAAFGGLIALFIAGIALGFVAWLLGLMRAAQSRQWDWLIAVLLLGAAGTLLYSLVGSRAEAAL